MAGLSAATLTAALAACGSSQPSATTVSVTSMSAEVAQTTLGPAGYREVGSGPPLVLIMGYAAPMEAWDPQFVDSLARRYRVVIFDNAGIGSTHALPAPLTIDAMANQTSALIGALGLGRPDVLGWSMGGMIAQALAVLHPAQVRRLVLCATFPGVDGVTPPQAAINDLTNGSGVDVMYPANQAMANDAFTADVESYPSTAAVPASVISAQRRAALWWFDGADAAGRRARVPVPGGDAVRSHGRVVPHRSGQAGEHRHDPGRVPGRRGGDHRCGQDLGGPDQGDAVDPIRLVRNRRWRVRPPDRS